MRTRSEHRTAPRTAHRVSGRHGFSRILGRFGTRPENQSEGTRRRAELLQELLSSKGLSAFLCIPLTAMPQPGQILLTDGTLPYGMEYPDAKLAVLTEGQLISHREQKKKQKKTATNRQKLNSFTDLTPGDLVVHENYGIGRFVAMEQIKVDGAIKDYIKIAYQGTDTLFVPATQLDLVSKYIGGGGEDGDEGDFDDL